MFKQLLILTAFGVITSNAVFSQKNNRISVQSGLFNCFFDGSPIVNKTSNYENKQSLNSLFGGRLPDSQGIELLRRINKSQISLEFMRLDAGFVYTKKYNSQATPQYMSKHLRFITCFYNRLLPITEKWNFQYGAGATYFWGEEMLYHYSWQNPTWTESYVTGYNRSNIGLNLKTGIDYTPIPWLTIYSNFNFLGSIYENNTIEPSNFYKEKYGMSNTPSKYSVSWRVGVGFNF